MVMESSLNRESGVYMPSLEIVGAFFFYKIMTISVALVMSLTCSYLFVEVAEVIQHKLKYVDLCVQERNSKSPTQLLKYTALNCIKE